MVYRNNICTEDGWFSGVGPVAAPHGGQNSLRGVPDAGRLLVFRWYPPAMSAPSVLPLHAGADWLRICFDACSGKQRLQQVWSLSVQYKRDLSAQQRETLPRMGIYRWRRTLAASGNRTAGEKNIFQGNILWENWINAGSESILGLRFPEEIN